MMEWIQRRGIGLVVVLLLVTLAEDAVAKKKDYYQLLEVNPRLPHFVGLLSLLPDPPKGGPGTRGFPPRNAHPEELPVPRSGQGGELQLPFSPAHYRALVRGCLSPQKEIFP